jgi:DNA-binding beta-propeller fold protein YncE
MDRILLRLAQIVTLRLTVVLLLTLVAAPVAADYCASNGSSVNYEWIEGVALGEMTNVSGSDGGYGDFTAQTIDLFYGSNGVTLTPGFRYGSYNEYWRIWVDLNQDMAFDADELLLDRSSRSAIDGAISIPESALTGETRMRISMKWGGSPSPCATFAYGEVEDYTAMINDPLPPLGVVSAIVPGKTPEVVYALDQDNDLLYTINTATQQISSAVELPDAGPVAMDLSAADDKLYIVSASSSEITVYDVPTQSVSQLPFSVSGTGRDIAVAPLLRRLYVLSPNGYSSDLSIVHMDTGQILHETAIGGSSIVVDEATQTVFTANSGISPATIYKYSVADDSLAPIQQVTAGSNGREINISPDGAHVVLPSGGGNGAGYTIFDYDASNLDNVFGEWDVGTYPKLAEFSPDGSILYGTNGSAYDQSLYVMDARSYQQIRKLAFPNADGYAVMSPNSDGSVVVGYSYDTYSNTDHRFYFFTDVLAPDDPDPVVLGKVSDMVAGATPDMVYAIDQDNAALYTVSTSQQSIVDTVMLPDSQPVAMTYSPSTNDVYIVSAFSGNVTVYDADTQELAQIPFSTILGAQDIAHSPTHDRLYVLSPKGYDSYLTVIDIGSGAIVLEEVVGGSSIVVDDATQTIFTAHSGLSPSTIFKYELTDAGLTLMQSLRSGSNGRKINISPDGAHIVFPCGGGNGPGYTVYDYAASNLDNVLGEWDVGTYPKLAVFGPDGAILYGANGSASDQYLYVMDAVTYQQIRKLSFPNADDYAVATANSDGTVVVGFSYDSYDEDAYALHFFTDVGP